MVVEKAPVEVIKVAWSKLAEHLELLFLHRLEHKFLVMRSEEAHRGFATSALPRLGLADGEDIIQVCSHIEAAHRLEALGVLDANLEINLGDLESLIDVVNSISLLFLDLHGRRLHSKYCALFKLQIDCVFLQKLPCKLAQTFPLVLRVSLVRLITTNCHRIVHVVASESILLVCH